ncbi:exosortase [Agarivorans sp. TSD2052]|uniref:exosortase n=1 Tax=Agarivorans sp. TSD2052 TaxID=2937286 RepID=UPI00200D7BFF|nr:exosortase [Agarivorans sp. TSD2052]UPW19205.1 exosortase [Agarivorans sp. TSD2052]
MEPNQVEVKQSNTGNLQALVVLGITGLVALLFWPVLLDIWRYSFDDGTYSHAFLIPLVALYVLYDCRRQLQFRQTTSLWLVLLVICLALELLFYLSQISLPVRALLPLVLLFSLLSAFKHNKGLYVYALVMLFATPIWGILSPPLQSLSTNMVEMVMAYTHVPSYFEGNVVSIPSGRFEIANGCSGLRYFITSLFLCLLYIYFNIRSLKKAAIFFIVCMLGALLVNWVRIITIILIGHETQMQSDIIYDHNNLGWYLYVPYLLLAFYIGGKLANDSMPTAALPKTSSPSVKPLAYLALALLAFSPSLIDWPVVDANKLNTHQQSPASPYHSSLQVTQFQSVEHQTIVVNTFEIHQWVYLFSGLGLDNKASFYLNDVVPEDLRVVRNEKNKAINFVYFHPSSNQTALLAYSYAGVNGMVANRAALRAQRFSEVLSGKRKSAIIAVSALCIDQSCSQVKTSLEQHLSQFSDFQLLLQHPG